MARTYLKICFDFEERTSELTPEEQGRLLLALLHYAATGEKERLPGNERFCYPAFCKDVDHDIEVYEGKVANGKQGGRPKKEQGEKTEQNQQEPMQTEQNQKEAEETSIKNKNKNKNKEQEQEQDQDQEQEQGQHSTLTYPPKSPQGGRGAGAKKEVPRGFELFWEIYPRKEARGEALKAWQALNPSLELETDILAHVQKRKDSWEWTKEGGRYVPHAASFLNQQRWEDEYTLAPPPSAPSYGRQEERCTFADLYKEQYGEVSFL